MEAFSLLVIEVGETSSLWMVTSWGWWSLGAVRKQDEQAVEREPASSTSSKASPQFLPPGSSPT